MAANGNVLTSEVNGVLKMKTFLTGMPELKLGLNDKVLLEANGRGASAVVFQHITCRHLLPGNLSSLALRILSCFAPLNAVRSHSLLFDIFDLARCCVSRL